MVKHHVCTFCGSDSVRESTHVLCYPLTHESRGGNVWTRVALMKMRLWSYHVAFGTPLPDVNGLFRR